VRSVRRAACAAVLAAALAGPAACGSDQDPGVPPAGDGGPGTTSVTLGPCPPGGPDETTPAAGCLDDDGTVVRP
jgi:hypothetical protein